MAEYYRLNFQRKPEHMGFPTNNLFTAGEAAQRVEAWQQLSVRVDAVKKALSPEFDDAFFELVEYPVKAAALENEKFLVPGESDSAQNEIDRLTDVYNQQIAGGKWRYMMSDNPRGQLDFNLATISAETQFESTAPANSGRTISAGREFLEARILWKKIIASSWRPHTLPICFRQRCELAKNCWSWLQRRGGFSFSDDSCRSFHAGENFGRVAMPAIQNLF